MPVPNMQSRHTQAWLRDITIWVFSVVLDWGCASTVGVGYQPVWVVSHHMILHDWLSTCDRPAVRRVTYKQGMVVLVDFAVFFAV